MLTEVHILPKSGKKPKQLVVFLHGYGSNGDDLIALGESWVDLLPDAEFISPNAPEACDINPVGYQWFGIRDFNPYNIRAGLDHARPLLIKYLKHLLEVREMNPSQLALVGFSQGTMMALDAIFALPGLRAVVGYSGTFYAPIAQSIPGDSPEVLLVHGDADMTVPYAAFSEAIRQLSLFGIHARDHTCPGLGHGIDTKGLAVGGEFLKEIFEKPDPVIYMGQENGGKSGA